MSQSIIYQFLKAGSQTITVPSGYSNQVLVYAWGAGGGSGTGAPGGGGGYAAGVVNISSGSTVVVSVGGAGGSTVGQTAAGSLAGLGNNPIIDLSGGVGAPGGDPEDNDAGGGGGGGGASAVFVNNIPMIVAAGAGGGGGLGEDWGGGDSENGKGRPGGVATQVNTVPKGADGRKGGAGGAGGGGGGYPFGGDSQRALYGDDVYSISQGGFGGQNYANATVTSATLTVGSGTNTAGTTNGYYPGKNLGKAGYDGCVILVFQKLFTAWIKQSGDWKQVSSAYIKVPTTSYTIYSTPSGSAQFNTVGNSLFTVPQNVYSLTISASGGGGGGGGADQGDTNHQLYGLGGSASNLQTATLAVTPGDVINFTIAAGGAGAVTSENNYPSGGTGGTTTVTRNGVVILTVAGGAGGASRATSSGPNAGQVSSNGGSNGGAGSASSYGTAGSAGKAGKVLISYTSTPIATVTRTGGWKQIVRGWLKQNGVWENIATPVTLTPTRSETIPTRRAAINIVIATNTSNYNLIEVLNGTGQYYPGYSDITLTINAGVTVDSVDAATPALTVDRLTLGDSLIIVNNGTIAGRGGDGGKAGVYTITSYPVYTNSKGSPIYNNSKGGFVTYNNVITASPGFPGAPGGTALSITYPATITNNGTIAGGGGGGGGGGGPTGGQGGGGAGLGVGANNGTTTTGGAGAGLGGAGGNRGAGGVGGTNGSSATGATLGGIGGVAGVAIKGYRYVTISIEGTILGPRA